MKYKIWNKQDNLITPVGEVLSPQQVYKKFPASQLTGIDYIVLDSPISMGVFMQYDQTFNIYRNMICERAITDDMTEDEIAEVYADYDAQSVDEFLHALEYFEDNPIEQEATAEERIAAALEMANILALPDVEV